MPNKKGSNERRVQDKKELYGRGMSEFREKVVGKESGGENATKKAKRG